MTAFAQDASEMTSSAESPHFQLLDRELDDLVIDVDKAFKARLESRKEWVEERCRELESRIVEISAKANQLASQVEVLKRKGPPPQPKVRRTPAPAARWAADIEPHLPQPLTIALLERHLRGMGFEVVNNRHPRTTGGGFWVITPKDGLQPIVDELKESGIHCRYYAGGRHRDRRAQWEVDCGKRLPFGNSEDE